MVVVVLLGHMPACLCLCCPSPLTLVNSSIIQFSPARHLQAEPSPTSQFPPTPTPPPLVCMLVGYGSGRLVPEKAPETFVRAAALLAHAPHLVFHLWGDGPERERLEHLSRRLGLDGRLRFMGATERPEEALAGMDIFAYPTTGESVGWVVLEALAAGLPVISSRVGAVPSFVRHGINGFLMEPTDGPEELSGLIETLADNPHLRLHMARHARAQMERECGLEAFGADYLSLYRSLAAAYRTPPDA
jgi:glycosyltransferase involved in cell wall biosynthesis